MQSYKKCEKCTKAECFGKNADGTLKFGCKNNSMCIPDLVVENPYRDQIKHEYKTIYKT